MAAEWGRDPVRAAVGQLVLEMTGRQQVRGDGDLPARLRPQLSDRLLDRRRGGGQVRRPDRHGQVRREQVSLLADVGHRGRVRRAGRGEHDGRPLRHGGLGEPGGQRSEQQLVGTQ